MTTECDTSDEAEWSLVDSESLDAEPDVDSEADEEPVSLPLEDGVLDESALVLEDSLSFDEPLSPDELLLDESVTVE